MRLVFGCVLFSCKYGSHNCIGVYYMVIFLYQLIKVEDGLMEGEVLFHDVYKKTDEEKEAIRKRREARK